MQIPVSKFLVFHVESPDSLNITLPDKYSSQGQRHVSCPLSLPSLPTLRSNAPHRYDREDCIQEIKTYLFHRGYPEIPDQCHRQLAEGIVADIGKPLSGTDNIHRLNTRCLVRGIQSGQNSHHHGCNERQQKTARRNVERQTRNNKNQQTDGNTADRPHRSS